MSKTSNTESFEDFKNSFSYGSRNDLNFKFLKGLTNQDAAHFFQDLLWKLAASTDDGDFDRIVQHIYEWQVRAYSGEGRPAFDDGPFAPLSKPVAESRLALLTSSGSFVEGDDPNPFGVKNMTQEGAIARIMDYLKSEPEISSIPKDTPMQNMRVRHGGYDIRGAQADPNVVFPLERLRELESDGVVGELAPMAYSFVGACSQSKLRRKSGPEWVKMLKQAGIEAVLLVPV